MTNREIGAEVYKSRPFFGADDSKSRPFFGAETIKLTYNNCKERQEKTYERLFKEKNGSNTE